MPGPGKPIRVLVADHHTMVAEAFRGALGSRVDIDVIGVAGTAAEALALLRTAGNPVVVVVDEDLPDPEGNAVLQIRRFAPEARVVVLAEWAHRAAIRAAVDAGCVGILGKTDAFDRLEATIRAAGSGRLAIPLDSLRALLEAEPAEATLTSRELQVLRLAAAGLSNRDIAAGLGIELNTARTHLQRIIRKMDAHSRLEAVARARLKGLFDS